MESSSVPLAFLINWGWLQIGPYIHINIDPVLLHIGPLALHWYGLMYVVAIVMGLWLIRGYAARQGITDEQMYRMLWWCVVAGLVGGCLYFVIQQPDLVSDYLLKPQHILATWEGGMAFYGAVFLIVPVLFWRALKERLNPLVTLDAGALFAACAQPFGRPGNLINGDIIGYPSTLPWSTVYDNPNSWACQNAAAGTGHVPVQPAAGYEILLNLLRIGVLALFGGRYRRPGMLLLTYISHRTQDQSHDYTLEPRIWERQRLGCCTCERNGNGSLCPATPDLDQHGLIRLDDLHAHDAPGIIKGEVLPATGSCFQHQTVRLPNKLAPQRIELLPGLEMLHHAVVKRAKTWVGDLLHPSRIARFVLHYLLLSFFLKGW